MLIRRATSPDADAIAAISTAARHAAMPAIRWPHTAEEDRAWVADILLPGEEVWVAEEDGNVLGFLALHDNWLNHLYLRPGHWRQGIGTALIAHAKARRPTGLQLWCFQVNTRARAFYEHHDFTISRGTGGAGNAEREPDVLYIWPGQGEYGPAISAAYAAMDGFMAAFNAEDAEALRTRWFHFPHVRFHSNTVTVMATPADFRSAVWGRQGQSEGWARTAWDYVEVVDAGAEKVHFRVQFTRYRADGSAIGSYRSLYIVTLKDGRWAIQGRSSWAA